MGIHSLIMTLMLLLKGMFPYSLSVLKMYVLYITYYRFLVLAVTIKMQSNNKM